MKKTILVNWTFHPVLRTNWSAQNTIWTCEGGSHQLLAINETDRGKLKEAIEIYAPKGELLVLLHKNPPHNATMQDIEYLYSTIKRKDKLVIRLFGGGTESLYFGPKSELGILGNRDNGLFATYFEVKEPKYNQVTSTFIIDRDSRKVNAEHLAYIWRNYWESPKKTVYRLMEDFRLHTDGFDFGADNQDAYLTHLQTNRGLWYALHAFAAQPQKEMPAQAEQYGLKTLQDYLETYPDRHDNLHNHLQQLRKTVGDTLKNGNITNYPDHVRTIYTDMFDLFKNIPVNL